jgi:hypothetical protein
MFNIDLIGPLFIEIEEYIISLSYGLHGEAWYPRGIKPSPQEAEFLASWSEAPAHEESG